MITFMIITYVGIAILATTLCTSDRYCIFMHTKIRKYYNYLYVKFATRNYLCRIFWIFYFFIPYICAIRIFLNLSMGKLFFLYIFYTEISTHYKLTFFQYIIEIAFKPIYYNILCKYIIYLYDNTIFQKLHLYVYVYKYIHDIKWKIF